MSSASISAATASASRRGNAGGRLALDRPGLAGLALFLLLLPLRGPERGAEAGFRHHPSEASEPDRTLAALKLTPDRR